MVLHTSQQVMSNTSKLAAVALFPFCIFLILLRFIFLNLPQVTTQPPKNSPTCSGRSMEFFSPEVPILFLSNDFRRSGFGRYSHLQSRFYPVSIGLERV